MAVFTPKKALEVNGQEIYPLTHAKQVIMDDGNRLNEKLKEIENSISGGQNVDLTGYAKSEDIPTDDHINGLIDTKLGVIENGTY